MSPIFRHMLYLFLLILSLLVFCISLISGGAPGSADTSEITAGNSLAVFFLVLIISYIDHRLIRKKELQNPGLSDSPTHKLSWKKGLFIALLVLAIGFLFKSTDLINQMFVY